MPEPTAVCVVFCVLHVTVAAASPCNVFAGVNVFPPDPAVYDPVNSEIEISNSLTLVAHGSSLISSNKQIDVDVVVIAHKSCLFVESPSALNGNL